MLIRSFLAIVSGFLIICTIILLGFRRYDGGLPLNATCSAVISAACHRPVEDEDAHLLPVKWGVIRNPRSLPSCVTDQLDNEGEEFSPEVAQCSEEEQHEIGDTSSQPDEIRNTIEEWGHCSFTTFRNVERPMEGHLYQ
jgi:hypothetical protein